MTRHAPNVSAGAENSNAQDSHGHGVNDADENGALWNNQAGSNGGANSADESNEVESS